MPTLSAPMIHWPFCAIENAVPVMVFWSSTGRLMMEIAENGVKLANSAISPRPGGGGAGGASELSCQ